MKRWAALLLMITAACGDPLVGESYIGAPIYTLSGTIETAGAIAVGIDSRDLRIGLFFVGFDARGHAKNFVEHQAEVDAAFTRFEMNVFDQPDAEALTFSDLANESNAEVGLALIVVYADQDGDQLLDAGGPYGAGADLVVGASRQHVVVYTSAPLAAAGRAGTLLGALEPGYHLFENSELGNCAFLDAFNCEGKGDLMRVENVMPVVTVFSQRENVLVPAPAIVPNGTVRDSIWTRGR